MCSLSSQLTAQPQHLPRPFILRLVVFSCIGVYSPPLGHEFIENGDF